MMTAVSLMTPLIWFAGSMLKKGEALSDYGQLLKENKLSKLIILPAYALRRLKYEGKFSYDRKTKVHIIEYYGKTDSDVRFLLHQSTKIAFMVLALEFCLLIGLNSVRDAGYFLVCALCVCSAFLLPDSRLNSDIKKRKIEIMLDFPDFLVKLTLLINAGMNVAKAWEKVSEGMDKSRALGRELAMSLLEIRSGKSESKAYEDFAKRCRIQEVTRVVSVLLQNIKKGNAELVSILRIHANECWEMRKNAAKKLGEEASSKMLLPMAIMLLSILLIVTTPAILALQGIV
jgi:tight adherence protein C